MVRKPQNLLIQALVIWIVTLVIALFVYYSIAPYGSQSATNLAALVLIAGFFLGLMEIYGAIKRYFHL